MANNIALPKLHKLADPETPPEEYLPPFAAFLQSVGKDGRTAGDIVHRTLMHAQKMFRVTRLAADYIANQPAQDQEALKLAYQLCCTLMMLDESDLSAVAGKGGAALVLESLSVATAPWAARLAASSVCAQQQRRRGHSSTFPRKTSSASC